MKSAYQGLEEEALILSRCFGRGYIVSLPFGGKAPYDLIVDTKIQIVRCQVKKIYKGKTNNGFRWMVDFMKPRGGARNLKYQKYSKIDCDYLLAVCIPQNTVYVFPVEAITNKRQATFYFNDKPHPNARNWEWVNEYKEVWF